MKSTIIGVPKEIKCFENRVSLTPAGAKELVSLGHTVLLEKSAGVGSGFLDEEYSSVGVKILESAKEVWENSELILKVKEPQASEYGYFRKGLLLFTYLHLAAEEELTKVLLESKVDAIAYETVALSNGSLPLLIPMSEIAGKMSIQIGAALLEKHHGGRGVLMGGVPGVEPADVVIIGGGTVGLNAAKVAHGMGANITILNNEIQRLRYISDIFHDNVKTLVSSRCNIEKTVTNADLVIGAALVAGAKAPKLITEDMVKKMRKGAAIVDVAIDQGGIVETIDRTTTHDNPTYEKYGVLHYAVPNIPGAVPRTSTVALTNATLPYVIKLANEGFVNSVKRCEELALGTNTCQGYMVSKPVAESLDLEYRELSMLVGLE